MKTLASFITGDMVAAGLEMLGIVFILLIVIGVIGKVGSDILQVHRLRLRHEQQRRIKRSELEMDMECEPSVFIHEAIDAPPSFNAQPSSSAQPH